MSHAFALLIVVSSLGLTIRGAVWAVLTWNARYASTYGPLPSPFHADAVTRSPVPLDVKHNGEADSWTANLNALREACYCPEDKTRTFEEMRTRVEQGERVPA